MTLPKTLLIVAALVMVGCSAENKLRRAKKLIAKAEAEGVEWKADTVYRDVIVTVPSVHFDTLVKVERWTDTLTVTRDKITTRVVVTPSTKTVYIESKAEPVTIIKRVPVTVNREIRVGSRWYEKVGLVFLGLVLGFGGCYVLKFLKLLR